MSLETDDGYKILNVHRSLFFRAQRELTPPQDLTMVLLAIPSTYVALLSASTAFVYLFVSCVLSYRKLCQYKGPLLASLSQYWLFKATIKSQVSSAGADVLKKYGKAS